MAGIHENIANPLGFEGVTCIGFNSIEITSTAQFLTFPKGTKSATIVAIKTNDITGNIIMQFREDGQTSTDSVDGGMPLTDLAIYKIQIGSIKIPERFSIVSMEGSNQRIQIQYFG